MPFQTLLMPKKYFVEIETINGPRASWDLLFMGHIVDIDVPPVVLQTKMFSPVCLQHPSSQIHFLFAKGR